MKSLTSEDRKKLKEEGIKLVLDARGNQNLMERVTAGLNVLVFLANVETGEELSEPDEPER